MDAQTRSLFNTLPALRRERSTLFGITIFAFCTAAWLLTLAAVVLLPLWLSIPASFANAITVAMLFIVAHDAAHGTLVSSLRMNRVIGILAFLPSLHPLTGWKRSHNAKHHLWTNLKGEDPGYPPFSLTEYRDLPPTRRFLERFYRSWAGIGFCYFVELYWKRMLFPTREYMPSQRGELRLDRAIIALFLIAEVVGVYCVSVAVNRPLPLLFTIYAVAGPYCVFLWLTGFVTYQQHTNAEIPWFDRKSDWSYFQNQVAGTVHMDFPPLLNVFFLNVLEHSAHHVDPMIPLYNLDKSQQVLETAYPGTIKIIGWSPRVLLTTLKCCKLYDYREHRWLDFNGKPTSPRLVPIMEPAELPKLAPTKASALPHPRLTRA
jgi:omega-6 fatty acid desaturase (delta-12 desaturase)